MGRQVKRQDVEKFSTVKKHVSPICDRLKTLVNKDNAGKLAEKLGVSVRSVHFWCQGSSRPDIDSLAAIADFFDTTVDYICGRTAVQTRTMDNISASEVYGLSVSTLDNLLLVKSGYFEDAPYMLAAVDALLGNKNFYTAIENAVHWYAKKQSSPDDVQEFCEWKAAKFMESFCLEFFSRNLQKIYDAQKEREK